MKTKELKECGCICHFGYNKITNAFQKSCSHCKKSEKSIHKIGEHGAIGFVVRRGKKIVRVCAECKKDILKPEVDDVQGY